MKLRSMLASIVCTSLLAWTFSSCADAAPELVSVTGTMVFDYEDSDSLPSARLAVFVQTSTEVQRVDSLLAVSRDDGYNWRIDSPQQFKSGDRQWACYTNLQSAENVRFPKGVYDFQYVDAAGEEAWTSFVVSYPDELFETKSGDIKSVLSSLSDSVALYDKSNMLIYFGKNKSNWNSNANIIREYPAAVTIRHCLSNSGNRVVCLLPAELLRTQETAGSVKDSEDE